MKWHDASAWPAGSVPGDNEKWVAGKAYSFFRRPDGLLVGISKMGWTTTSRDDGRTWSQPTVPPTLVTGKAKVWSQRTADGRYALVYNPSTRNRFPLIVVTSDDGIIFRDMRIVQGELPVQRYAGLHRSIGPQYVRGISAWSDDGSRVGEGAIWLVYSMSKEDIWVSRVPVPIVADTTNAGAEHWNLYSPKWAPATVEGDELRLEDRDPYDYTSATRVFGERRRVTISFDVRPEQDELGCLVIEIRGKFGSPRPVQLIFMPLGKVYALSANPEARTGKEAKHVGAYRPHQTLSFVVDSDAEHGRFSVWLDGALVVQDAEFAEPSESLHRITFRTKLARGVSGSHPIDPETDRPTPPVAFRVRDVRVEP
jgi:hypothetical protein